MMIRKRIGRTSALAFSLAASLTAFGCGDDGAGTDTPDAGVVDTTPDAMVGTVASLTIAPTMPDFGSVVVGDTSAATTLTVTNAGDNASTALTIAIGGTNATDFIITNDTCDGNTLAGGATCTVDVTFTAGASGARSASLSATAATGGSATATLRGTGADPAALSVSPTPHDFGGAVINATSSDFTFTVTNNGDQDSGTISANLAGGDAIHFAIVTNNCDGQTLAANATCTVIAHFAPTSSGNKTTTLSVTSSPGGTVTATLSGNGLVDAALEITPLVQDFGSVTQGNTSSNVTLIVRNNGDVDSGTLTSGLAGTDVADFTVSADSCANTVVAAGGTCTIVLSFSPQSPGNKTASYDVSGTPGGSTSSTLTGVGLAPGSISISPTPHDFGSTTVGATGAQQVFTVTNNGGSPTGALGTALNGADPTDFPIVAGSNGCQGRVLPAGGNCTIAIAFSPIASGNRTASLSVTGVPGGTAPASLSGTGLSPALLNVAPPAWDFGSVGTDVTSSPRTFTVSNLGDTTSGSITAEILGTNFSHFNMVNNGCTAPLASGDSCAVIVEFAPSTVGDKVATLEVVASPGGTHNSILNGNGITPGQLQFTGTPVVSSADFGSGIIDANSSNTVFTIRNAGMAPTAALATSITGQFTVQSDNCVGVVLNATESCTIAVRFEPRTSAGAKTGSLGISGTPGGTLSGGLNGVAVDKITVVPAPTFTYVATKYEDVRPANFVVTNNTADFGTRTRTFTQSVTNTGGEWSLTDNCPNTGGMGLGVNASCTVTVTFAPNTGAGAPGNRTSVLTVTGTGGADAGTQTVALNGPAVGPLTLVEGCYNPGLARTFGAFGDTVVGEEQVSCFTVTNTATAVGAVTGALSTTFTPRGDFAVLSDDCAGRSLAGNGDICQIEVMFFPQTRGLVDFDLKVRSTASYEVVRNVEATGLSAATLVVSAVTSADFGQVASTNSGSRTFRVTNTGEEIADNVGARVACETGSGCGEFSETSVVCTGTATTGPAADPRDLRQDEFCTITGTFSPLVTTEPGSYTAMVEGQGRARLRLTAPLLFGDLEMTAESISQLTVSPGTPSPFAFGTQLRGTPSTPVVFTVTNISTSAAVNGASVSAPDPHFTVPGATNGCTNIPAGLTCTFEVIYTPDPEGLPAIGPFLDRTDLTVGSLTQVGAVASTELTGQPVAYPRLAFDNDHTPYPGADAGFGGSTTGTEGATRTFTLRNTGGSVTTALTSSFSVDANHWTVTDNCMGTTLAPDATCTYVVKFTPLSPTTGIIDLVITANTSNGSPMWDKSDTATMQGQATAAVGFTITPAFHDFGDVVEDLGGSGPTTTFTVTNNTGAPATPTRSIQQNGTSTDGFAIVSGCTSQLAAAETCTLTVRYQPRSNRRDNFGGLMVGTAVAGLFGHADMKPTLLFNGATTTAGLTFTGNTGIGSVRTMTIDVRNVGDLTSGAIGITKDGPVASAYTLTGCAGSSLPANQVCTITATFAPLGAGVMAAAGHVTATPGTTTVPGGLTLNLSGTGASQAALGITPQALQDCRNGNAGQAVPAERDVTCFDSYIVSNVTVGVATGPLAFAVADPNFTAVGSPNPGGCVAGQPLPGETTCTIDVHYKPLAAGTHNGTLSVTADPGATVTAPVSGVGVSALSVVGLPTGSVNFGCHVVDQGVPPAGFASATLTYENATGTPVLANVLTVNLGGANVSSYAVTTDGCTGKKLAAGATCNVTVRFIPLTVTENLAGTLVVSDGTANKTAGTVSFSGDGRTSCPIAN